MNALTSFAPVESPFPHLCRFKADGLTNNPEAKAFILAEAEAGLIRAYGSAQNRTAMDYTCALELAAERWFEKEGGR